MADDRELVKHRVRPELSTLLIGIAALAVAAMALLDATPLAPSLDPRWVLAGGAVLIGIVLLVATMRPLRRSRRTEAD